MKTVKIILSIFSALIGAAVSVCLVWGLLYLCIAPVKNWTDDHIFNTNEEKVVEGEHDSVEGVSLDMENKIIKVEV